MSDITLKLDWIYLCDTTHSLQYIPDNSVDLIIIDPPYGTERPNDGYDDSQLYVFSVYDIWMKEFYRILKEGGHIYIFVPTLLIHKWIQKVDDYFTYKNLIATQCYVNNRFMRKPNNNFGFDAQYIIFAHKGIGREFNQVDWIPTSEEWLRDKRNQNPKPFTYMYPNYIYYDLIRANIKANEQVKKQHPNVKNPNLIADFIQMSSNIGDVVADFFMGSGSTAIACLKTNRHYFGFELNENHYKNALQRIEQYKKTLPTRNPKSDLWALMQQYIK